MAEIDIWKFFKRRGKITYCPLCASCTHNCKQSYKVLEVMCKKYNKRVVGFNRKDI